jgi:uncharacterized protein YdbL (DUF1318 family)
MKRILSVLAVLVTIAAGAQSGIDTSYTNSFKNFPPLAKEAKEAYHSYYPTGKVSPQRQYLEGLKKHAALLSRAADHKSRLLSMIAGTYDQEDQQVDFSKVVISKDKELASLVTQANTAFFDAIERASRQSGASMDSAAGLKGMALAERQLADARRQLPELVALVQKQWLPVMQLMRRKGYDKVLAEGKTTHPYFIQLLEVKGLILDKLIKLAQQADILQQSVARQVAYCQDHPQECQ